MAEPLSYFDAITWDEELHPSNGISSPSEAGLTVEIHRNWLHVLAPSLWRPGSLPSPVVLILSEGEGTILDVNLVARRGPQDGIYFAAWTVNGFALIGAGVRGTSAPPSYQGVTVASYEFLLSTLADWTAESRIPSHLLAQPANPLRFNQGNAWIARGAGTPVLDVSPVGQAQPPLIFSTPQIPLPGA